MTHRIQPLDPIRKSYACDCGKKFHSVEAANEHIRVADLAGAVQEYLEPTTFIGALRRIKQVFPAMRA